MSGRRPWLPHCRTTKILTSAARYQLERLAYFCADPRDSKPGKPVFNRTITLKDTWAKEQGKA